MEDRLKAIEMPNTLTPESVLRGYFRAKDENRPHLLDGVFARDAEVVIRNGSQNIAFPAVTQGRSAIAEVLVRSVTPSYENVRRHLFPLAHSAVRRRHWGGLNAQHG
jgi:hypothetical protein